MDNLGNWIEVEKYMKYHRLLPTEPKKKLILAICVIHEKNKRKYFRWTWGMIWTLIKYKVFWGMDITMTVSKVVDREEYYVRFYTL